MTFTIPEFGAATGTERRAQGGRMFQTYDHNDVQHYQRFFRGCYLAKSTLPYLLYVFASYLICFHGVNPMQIH
jgi:hypothetical protein